MTKVINTLLFIRELVLGREASRTQTKRHKVITIVFIASLAISLTAHFYSVKYLYKSYYEIVHLKKQLEKARQDDERCHDIEVEKKAFEQICQSMRNNKKPTDKEASKKTNAMINNQEQTLKPKKSTQ